VGPKDVQQILDASRKNNPKLGITGTLCYDPKFFLQCLEGPRDAVNDLYRTILSDPRHENVILIDFSEIHVRAFEDWSMDYVRTSDLSKSLLLKYSADDTFDPYTMSAQQALGFISALAKERHEFLEHAAKEIKKKKK
jgi:hypothetical protein